MDLLMTSTYEIQQQTFNKYLMEDDGDLCISLDELLLLESEEQDVSSMKNPFAFYLTSNSSHIRKKEVTQIMALDTQTLPVIPIRRNACTKCLKENLPCQQCSQCIKISRVCCRGIGCIYDYHQYTKSRDKQVYNRCTCMHKYFPSSQSFSIDWRLLYLIDKLGKTNKINYTYYLYFSAGLFWITEEKIDKDGQRNMIRTVFEEKYKDNLQIYEESTLEESNLYHLQNLFKEQVKQHLNYKEQWDASRLEEECDQIVQKFKRNELLRTFKNNLENGVNSSQESLISTSQIRSKNNLLNLQVSQVLYDPRKFSKCSRSVNCNCLFFYHNQQKKLFLVNSSFEKNIPREGLKAFNITSSQQTFQNSIWFKDRKGDIFAISGSTLSIFKYHLQTKKMKCIQLRTDKLYSSIKYPDSLVYVDMLDRVYYFDSENLSQSVYFNLYRPEKQEKQFSNCLSAHLPTAFLDTTSNQKSQYPLKATYILQTSKQNPKIQVPVLYTLQFKRTYLPLPFRLSKIIHRNEKRVKVEDIISTQDDLEESLQDFDFSNSILTIFKKKNHSIIALLCRNNRKMTLVEGIIIQSSFKTTVKWSIYHIADQHLLIEKLPIFEQIHLNSSKQVTRGLNSQKQSSQAELIFGQSKKYPQKEGFQFIRINDLDGLHTNNTSRFLVFSSRDNYLYELVLSICQGKYTLRLFSFS